MFLELRKRTTRLIATPLSAGLFATAVLLVAFLTFPQSILDRPIEPVRDVVLRAALPFAPTRPIPRVVVVDIDSKTIETVAAWPWPRETVAALVESVIAARPSTVAIDIMFENADTRSPAALARQLGARLGRNDLTALAQSLPDGDRKLAAAITDLPVILGFLVNPLAAGSIDAPPIVARGLVDLADIWRATGLIGPPEPLAGAARGIGALSLRGDANGTVRRVPLLVAADGRPYPGLALEALRVHSGATRYILDGPSRTIQLAGLRIPLPGSAMLRLAPVGDQQRTISTVSAADVMAGRFDPSMLAGSVVLIGGSAPELGGLRPTAFNPLTSSVQIQADAFAQLARGFVPRPPQRDGLIRLGSLLAAALLALLAALTLRPLIAALAVALFVATVSLASVALAARLQLLFDPLLPSLAALAVFAVTVILDFAITQRRETRVRERFAQHLAPQVVSLIVADPELVKLSGERREITALFTDIEGFTTMTDRLGPQDLVSLLDRYFEGVAAIVMKHGGMIDKLVGDAVHAFFNAPLDQAEHWRHAIECAIEIRNWTEQFRALPENKASAIGRTRIGIETGDAVVGDVGIRAKLDYTAHGNAINTAARLEAANKELGSAICIGSGAAGRYGIERLKPLGMVKVRGLNTEMAVYEPKE
jgi:adenylate cyclase